MSTFKRILWIAARVFAVILVVAALYAGYVELGLRAHARNLG